MGKLQFTTRILHRRLCYIAAALGVQLCLLLFLSYRPDTFRDIWPSRPEPQKTRPTVRQRPWTVHSTGQSLCADRGRLPKSWELAPIAESGERGALVFPEMTGMRWAQQDELVIEAATVCAWLVVVDWGDGLVEAPYYTNGTDMSSLPEPIPLWPPDSVEIRAIGKHFTVPVHMDNSHVVVKGSGRHSVDYRVYNVVLDLKDQDTFTLDVVLEYTDYLWNYEKPAHVFWAPTPLPIYVDRKSLRYIPALVFTTSPQTHPAVNHEVYTSLPPCTTGNNPGRWVPVPFLKPTTSLNLTSELSSPNAPDLVMESYTSYTYLPYTCRYVPKTYPDFRKDCLEPHHPFVHLFGDSNVRRAVKAIGTDGAWCKTWFDEESSNCQCTDWHLGIEGLDPGRPDNSLHLPTQGPHTDVSSWLYVFLWKGLNDWGPNWKEALSLEHQPSAIPNYDQIPKKTPTSVVISLTNWDAAYGSYASYVASIPTLIDLLKTTYAQRNIPIIWRPGQYFGGRADTTEGDSRRRFSRLRVMAFNTVMEKALVDAFGAKVWDVYSIGESLDVGAREKAVTCPSGHAGRDIVDMENVVFMNMLCPIV